MVRLGGERGRNKCIGSIGASIKTRAQYSGTIRGQGGRGAVPLFDFSREGQAMARRRGETKKGKAKMKQKEKKYEHLTYKKRLRLEVMLRQKIHKQTIADELRVHISTIYREIKRGEYEHLNSDYTTEIRYSG